MKTATPWMTPADRPWIGVDMDGTFAEYHDTWLPWNVFGAPILPMVARMRDWIAEGKDVRIVTARVFPYVFNNPVPDNDVFTLHHEATCLVTGTRFTVVQMIEAIQDYTEKHVGARLPCTCAKDYKMVQLWDDRAVQVVPNTGRTLADEHAAIVEAMHSKAQGAL